MNPIEWDRARMELKRDEALKLRLYRDSKGKLTIGWGHNIEDRGISPRVADYILETDMEEHWEELRKRLPLVDTLNSVRQRVLFNMAFNMGIPTLLSFKGLIAAIEAKQWKEAKRHILQSKYAADVGPRAIRNADLMEKGVDE